MAHSDVGRKWRRCYFSAMSVVEDILNAVVALTPGCATATNFVYAVAFTTSIGSIRDRADATAELFAISTSTDSVSIGMPRCTARASSRPSCPLPPNTTVTPGPPGARPDKLRCGCAATTNGWPDTTRAFCASQSQM